MTTTHLLPRRSAGDVPVPAAVSATHVGEVAVLRCTGDLDLAALEEVATAVRSALAARPNGLVLDLGGVTFCDTVGLRLLLSTAARARGQGCAFALAEVRPPVAEFLSRVCADRSLPAYADVAAAIEGMAFAGDWR